MRICGEVSDVRILWRPANCNECRFGYHCQQRASDCFNLQRGSRNKLISYLLNNFIINLSMAASPNPLRRSSRGWGVFMLGNHAARQKNGSSWWRCLCDVCFASKKSSKRKLFVPTRMHLGVKLLLLTWRNRRLPSPSQINSSVCLSVRPSVCRYGNTVYFSISKTWS